MIHEFIYLLVNRKGGINSIMIGFSSNKKFFIRLRYKE